MIREDDRRSPQPWFGAVSVDAGAKPSSRRLLLVSYHFPPDPAVGGLRWQQLSRLLAERGWSLDVITRDLATLQSRDDQRLRVLPSDLRIYCASEGEFFLARTERAASSIVRRVLPRRKPASSVALSHQEIARPSSRGLIRAYNAWARIANENVWGRVVKRIGIALSRMRPYDAIVSSGPPHMSHEAARQISRATGTPLIIDLRDPWSAVEQVAEDHASPVWFSIARRFERRAVRDSSLVIMNTAKARDQMRSLYPWATERIVDIPNGSDDEPMPTVPPAPRFSIRFAGTIYLDRDPRLVFRAAAMVVRRLGLTPDLFRMEFIGHVEEFGGLSVRSMAAEEGLDGFVDVGGQRLRAEATEFLAGATMLLNLPQGADMCVPAKVFEYMRFNAWLLILAKEGSATADTFRGTSADVVDPNDVERMADVIQQRYTQYIKGERPLAVGHDGRFDRSVQADRLVRYLETQVIRAERRLDYVASV